MVPRNTKKRLWGPPVGCHDLELRHRVGQSRLSMATGSITMCFKGCKSFTLPAAESQRFVGDGLAIARQTVRAVSNEESHHGLRVVFSWRVLRLQHCQTRSSRGRLLCCF